MIAMWCGSQDFEAEARKKAEDKAQGINRVGLSPAALKRRLAAKKAAAREAKRK